MSLADLVDALREVLKRVPEDQTHEIVGDRISIRDRIPLILDRLRSGDVEFTKLFEGDPSRSEVVATFLALLELVRMRVVRASQSQRFGAIVLALAVPGDASVSLEIKDDYKG
jgi:segregation and condensation protein A